MITEGLIIAMIACAGLLLLGLKMRRIQIIFISSVGWLVCGLQLYQQTEEILPTILLLMLAISQFFLLSRRND